MKGVLKLRAVAAAQRLVNRTGYELTRDRFRHRFLHTLDMHDVTEVLDIGANAGQFGTALRRAGYRGRIVSVEPLRAPFVELSRVAGADPRWDVEHAAVSAGGGTLTMNVSANSVSSSVLPILERSTAAEPATAYVATEQVRTVSVDELVDTWALTPERGLLKIDVQGYEMAVLGSAAKTLDRFAAIRTELSLVPLYAGQALLAEMIDYLDGRGFELWSVEPGWVEPSTRRLLQLDGVFYRTPST